MGRFDDPSAGKFTPPPGAERFEAPSARRAGSWAVGALLMASVLARESLHWLHPRGVMGLAGAMLALILFVAHAVIRRKVREGDEATPYSEQQRITR